MQNLARVYRGELGVRPNPYNWEPFCTWILILATCICRHFGCTYTCNSNIAAIYVVSMVFWKSYCCSTHNTKLFGINFKARLFETTTFFHDFQQYYWSPVHKMHYIVLCNALYGQFYYSLLQHYVKLDQITYYTFRLPWTSLKSSEVCFKMVISLWYNNN